RGGRVRGGPDHPEAGEDGAAQLLHPGAVPRRHPEDDRVNPTAAVAHLTPGNWAEANRFLVRKALAEFAHERLITPERLPDGRYRVRSDDGTVEYRFAADVLTLEHWRIDPAG